MKRFFYLSFFVLAFITGCRENPASIIKKNIPTFTWRRLTVQNFQTRISRFYDEYYYCVDRAIDSLKREDQAFRKGINNFFGDHLGNQLFLLSGTDAENKENALIERHNEIVGAINHYQEEVYYDLFNYATPAKPTDTLNIHGANFYKYLIGSPNFKKGSIDTLYIRDVIYGLVLNAEYDTPIPIIDQKKYNEQDNSWTITFKNTPTIVNAFISYNEDGRLQIDSAKFDFRALETQPNDSAVTE